MALELPTLEELDADEVARWRETLWDYLGGAAPGADLRIGVLHDLVVRLGALVPAALAAAVAQLERAASLQAIAADPEAVDPEVLQRVLSNYLIEPRTATAASGHLVLVFADNRPRVVARGTPFAAAGGVTVATSAAHSLRVAEANLASPDDRLLVPQGDGTYTAVIPVTAEQPGAVGRLRQGAAALDQSGMPGLLSARVQADFQGGQDAETAGDLVARARAGLAARCWSNRATITALVVADPRFATAALSVVGAGDPELARARRGVVPIAVPGVCDVYARTAAVPVRELRTVEAVTLGLDDDGMERWQFTLGRDVAPGFYDVVWAAADTAAADASSLEVIATARGADVSGAGWRPDLPTAADAAFSRYQTAVVQVRDQAGAATSPRTLQIVTRRMPDVDALQDWLGGRSLRPPGADVLVRAPVPCFVTVTVAVVAEDAATADAGTVAAAVAARVNQVPFAGTLARSDVLAAADAAAGPGAWIERLDLRGRLLRPDGTVRYLQAVTAPSLVVPEEPDRGVGPRSVAFLCGTDNVAVTTRVAAPSAV